MPPSPPCKLMAPGHRRAAASRRTPLPGHAAGSAAAVLRRERSMKACCASAQALVQQAFLVIMPDFRT